MWRRYSNIHVSVEVMVEVEIEFMVEDKVKYKNMTNVRNGRTRNVGDKSS
jgi:hypothetical protein